MKNVTDSTRESLGGTLPKLKELSFEDGSKDQPISKTIDMNDHIKFAAPPQVRSGSIEREFGRDKQDERAESGGSPFAVQMRQRQQRQAPASSEVDRLRDRILNQAEREARASGMHAVGGGWGSQLKNTQKMELSKWKSSKVNNFPGWVPTGGYLHSSKSPTRRGDQHQQQQQQQQQALFHQLHNPSIPSKAMLEGSSSSPSMNVLRLTPRSVFKGEHKRANSEQQQQPSPPLGPQIGRSGPPSSAPARGRRGPKESSPSMLGPEIYVPPSSAPASSEQASRVTFRSFEMSSEWQTVHIESGASAFRSRPSTSGSVSAGNARTWTRSAANANSNSSPVQGHRKPRDPVRAAFSTSSGLDLSEIGVPPTGHPHHQSSQSPSPVTSSPEHSPREKSISPSHQVHAPVPTLESILAANPIERLIPIATKPSSATVIRPSRTVRHASSQLPAHGPRPPPPSSSSQAPQQNQQPFAHLQSSGPPNQTRPHSGRIRKETTKEVPSSQKANLRDSFVLAAWESNNLMHESEGEDDQEQGAEREDQPRPVTLHSARRNVLGFNLDTPISTSANQDTSLLLNTLGSLPPPSPPSRPIAFDSPRVEGDLSIEVEQETPRSQNAAAVMERDDETQEIIIQHTDHDDSGATYESSPSPSFSPTVTSPRVQTFSENGQPLFVPSPTRNEMEETTVHPVPIHSSQTLPSTLLASAAIAKMQPFHVSFERPPKITSGSSLFRPTGSAFRQPSTATVLPMASVPIAPVDKSFSTPGISSVVISPRLAAWPSRPSSSSTSHRGFQNVAAKAGGRSSLSSSQPLPTSPTNPTGTSSRSKPLWRSRQSQSTTMDEALSLLREQSLHLMTESADTQGPSRGKRRASSLRNSREGPSVVRYVTDRNGSASPQRGQKESPQLLHAPVETSASTDVGIRPNSVQGKPLQVPPINHLSPAPARPPSSASYEVVLAMQNTPPLPVFGSQIGGSRPQSQSSTRV